MGRAALGFKPRTGRAVLVVLTEADEVIERAEVPLLPPGEFATYHAAEGLEPEAARKYVKGSIARAQRLATAAIRGAVKRCERAGHEVAGCGILVGTGMPDWTTDEILAVHIRMHKAEGELFRNVLVEGSKANGIEPATLPDKGAFDAAAKKLRITRAKLDAKLAAIGKAAGPPWGAYQKEAAAAALVAMLTLTGCDNFRESVSVEPWKPAATTEPPAAPLAGREVTIAMTVVAEGSGPEVKAGDLVRLRYARTTLWADKTERPQAATEAWVWTGREPDPNTELWGKFGTPELRSALIGRRVGEKFELRVPAKHQSVTVPQYAIAGPVSLRKGHNQFIGQYGAMEPKVLAGGETASEQPSWSVVEIVSACPAKFATRTGRMTQWGYVASLFGDRAWDTNRAGDLKWSAIEAKCPAPDGDVRFMLGPIYWTAEPVVPGMLMAWETTYRSQRLKASFPDDYAFVTINGRVLPTQP